jgi:hypothetical protein
MTRFGHLLLFASLLCAPACTTYSVRRSALVPHIAPVARSGQPIQGKAEVALGSPTAFSFQTPREGDRANAGLYLPTVQIDGSLRARIGHDLDLGFVWDQGLDDGAVRISDDQPKPRGGDTYGGGVSLFYSAEVGPAFRLGMAADLLVYSVPVVEHRTCVSNCFEASTVVTEDRRSVSVLSLGLVPSWHEGRWTVFGGLTAKNHPTNTKGEIDSVLSSPDESDADDIRPGPFNLIAAVGAEVELAHGVRGLVQLYQPLTQEPVVYGPSVGVEITVPLGTAN